MNAIGIIKRGFKLVAKDDKLSLQLILLVIFPFSILVLLHYLLASPLLHKVEDTYETSSLDPNDACVFATLEIPFFISFSLVWLFATTITISASAKTCSETSTTLKDLLLLWVSPSTWKKPFITWLYFLLPLLAYILLLSLSQFPIWALGSFLALTYPYLASVWTLGLVISVVEQENEFGYGAKAIGEAHKLMAARKLDGYLLIFTLVVLSTPINVLFYLTTLDDDDEIGTTMRFGFMFVSSFLFCLANLFTYIVFTVFYFDCKRGEKGSMEFGCGYNLVPSPASDDTVFP